MKVTFAHPRQPCRLKGLYNFTIPEVHNTWVNEFLFDKPGVIGSGGNSGFPDDQHIRAIRRDRDHADWF